MSTCLQNIRVYNACVSGKGDLFNSARSRHKPTTQHSVHHHRSRAVVDSTARVRQCKINKFQCYNYSVHLCIKTNLYRYSTTLTHFVYFQSECECYDKDKHDFLIHQLNLYKALCYVCISFYLVYHIWFRNLSLLQILFSFFC